MNYKHWLFSRSLLVVALYCGVNSTGFAQPATEQRQETARASIRWLEERSMLFQASGQAHLISGKGVQWRHAYGEPQPREAVKQASVWLLDYPGSVIARPGKSVIATWGDPQLWEALERIGIELLHTGPIKQAGGGEERRFTPTIARRPG